MIGAGLMSRPADGDWMLAGVLDGMVPEDPNINVNIGLEVLNSEGIEVPLDGDVADYYPDVPPDVQLTYGRLFVLLKAPTDGRA